MWKLTIDLFNHDSKLWCNINSIDDLIKEEINEGHAHSSIYKNLRTKSPDKKRVHLKKKQQFLYLEIKNIMENQELKDQLISKKRIGLLNNLMTIQQKIFGLDHKYYREISTWLQSIERSLKNGIFDTLICSKSAVTEILLSIHEILVPNSDIPVPISDITTYLNPDRESINATNFVKDFKNQFTKNYDKWDNLHLIQLRNKLTIFSSSIHQTLSQNADSIFSQNLMEHLDLIYRYIIQLKEELINLCDFLDGHFNFCQNVLETIHLEAFSPKAQQMGDYIKPYHEKLKEIFDNERINLPVVIPMIIDMKENEYEIKTEKDFNYFKKYYTETISLIEKMESSIPSKWPQPLPNLSTDNGKPWLSISTKNDYCLILSSYHIFINRMENLKNEFIITLRTCYKLIEVIKRFHDPKRSLSHLIEKEPITPRDDLFNSPQKSEEKMPIEKEPITPRDDILNSPLRSEDKSTIRSTIPLVKRPRINVKSIDNPNGITTHSLAATSPPTLTPPTTPKEDSNIHTNTPMLNRRVALAALEYNDKKGLIKNHYHSDDISMVTAGSRSAILFTSNPLSRSAPLFVKIPPNLRNMKMELTNIINTDLENHGQLEPLHENQTDVYPAAAMDPQKEQQEEPRDYTIYYQKKNSELSLSREEWPKKYKFNDT